MPILNLQDLEKLQPKPSGKLSLDELMQLPEKSTSAPAPKYGGILDKVLQGETLPVAQEKQPTLTQSILGNNNPLSKTYDIATDALADVPGMVQRDWREPANFLAAAPFRAINAPTPGDALAYFGYTGANDAERRFIENNPGIITALGAVGEVAPGVSGILGMGANVGAPPLPAPRPTVPGSRTLGRARANMGEAGAYGSILEELPGTIDEFANSVATGASRNDVTTNRRTLDILGEEMQRANGDVAQAQAATIARISQETGVTPQTAQAQIRRLTQVHEESPLMFGEYPAVAASDATQRLRDPANIDLNDLGRVENTSMQATLDYLANNGNAQSAQNVRNAISRRQEGLDPLARETLGDIGPQVQTGPRSSRPATIEDTAQMVADAEAAASRDYTAAYSSPIQQSWRLQNLPAILERYANIAATSAPEVGRVIRTAVDQFLTNSTQSVTRTIPDPMAALTGSKRTVTTQVPVRRAQQGLRQLQDARTTVRGQMKALAKDRPDLARRLQPLYDYITRTMEEMSPDWARANRRWADMNLQEMAQELGDAFSGKAGPRHREQMAEFRNLDPRAQDIVRVHFLQKYLDKLDNAGDEHSLSKIWANDHSRNMIRAMFGDQAVVRFTRMVRDQKVAENSSAMTKNSKTHLRGMVQKKKDAETGLVAAVNSANAQGAKMWILERLQQLLTEHRNRPMAEALTVPMNDTARVAQNIQRMRMQQERLNRYRPRATTLPNPVRPLPGFVLERDQ